MSRAVPEPFLIQIPDEDLDRLRESIAHGQRCSAEPETAWTTSEDCQDFARLCEYWVSGFEWKKHQADLNKHPQFTLDVESTRVHFVHQRAAGGPGIPLILAHSCPSTFLEYLPLLPILTNPAEYGFEGPGFDVVIPSLPGFSFSERPRGKAWTYAGTARLWHGLMAELGYSSFAGVGTGFGAGVVTMMARQQPEQMLALQLNGMEVMPPATPGQALSTAELLSLAQSGCWVDAEASEACVPVPKSNTLAFALADSPYSVAAWIVQRWRLWAGPEADLRDTSAVEELLIMLTLYWCTGTRGAAILDFYDNRAEPPQFEPGEKITVPTALSVFADPREKTRSLQWQERLYRLERITEFPRAGCFGKVHDPQFLARELFDFFRQRAT